MKKYKITERSDFICLALNASKSNMLYLFGVQSLILKTDRIRSITLTRNQQKYGPSNK